MKQSKTKIIFEEEHDYCKPKRVGNSSNNNYIEYESNDDRSKNISVKEHLNEVKTFLKDIAFDLQKSGT